MSDVSPRNDQSTGVSISRRGSVHVGLSRESGEMFTMLRYGRHLLHNRSFLHGVQYGKNLVVDVHRWFFIVVVGNGSIDLLYSGVLTYIM